MNLLLNLIILLLLLTLGLYRLTKDHPEKRRTLFNGVVNAPKNFYKNCKILVKRIKNKEL